MRKLFYGISVVAMALGMVACDDSVSSANNEDADKESSSSVISEDASSSSVKPGYSSSVELASSSSVKPSSSSSVNPGSSSSKKDDPMSSSSVVSSSSEKSSSSVNSSSSIESSSSSSVTLSDMSSLGGDVEGSSSSAINVESSSSSRGASSSSVSKAAWMYLNPESSYGEMTDSRDGQVYKTVKIGDQVWMAENLNYDYNKGTAKSYCYDDNEANCDVTGRLYTWAAAIDSVALANDADNPQICGYGKTCTLPTVVQGVCPGGWHLPSYDEWETLFKAVGGSSAAGKAKSGSGWYSNGNGTDAFGFSALPAGFRSRSGYFFRAGYGAYFWSASEGNSYSAYYVGLDYYDEAASMDYGYKYDGHSVRCLQNSN